MKREASGGGRGGSGIPDGHVPFAQLSQVGTVSAYLATGGQPSLHKSLVQWEGGDWMWG